MKNLSLLCCIAFSLAACQQAAQKQAPAKKAARVQPAKAVKATGYVPDMRVQIPVDTVYPAYILTPEGVSHHDEVEPKYAKHQWMGLFKSAGRYYTKVTTVAITKAQDEIVDEAPSEKTGWKVTPSVKDSAIILISGLDYVKSRPVIPFNLKSQMLMPGDAKHFSYQNIDYTLYATGKNIAANGDFYNVLNYKLYLKATINGVSYNQQLVYISGFNDAMVTVRFIGDIDGDGRPDFILDTTNHYNMERPTLYLSKPATGKNLVEVVGLHVYVGC